MEEGQQRYFVAELIRPLCVEVHNVAYESHSCDDLLHVVQAEVALWLVVQTWRVVGGEEE